MPLASTNPTLIPADHKDGKLFRLADFFSSLLNKVAKWVSAQVKSLSPLYKTLGAVLSHNAQQASKQPVEAPLNELKNFLNNMNLSTLSNQQVMFVESLGISRYIGKQGRKWVSELVTKSGYDPATASSEVNSAISALDTAATRSDKIIEAFKGLSVLSPEDQNANDRVVVRLEFRRDAAISDIPDWKSSAAQWYEIIRGVGAVIGETPEEAKVLGATNGSIILTLSASMGFTKILATISKHITGIAKDVLDVLHSIEELKGKRILNESAERALRENATTHRETGVQRILEEIKSGLSGELPPEKETALRKSVEKILEFHNKGGDIDYVAPEPSPTKSGEDDGMAELVQSVRGLIEDTRRGKEAIALITSNSSSEA